jgi:hypothetical protein
MPVRDHPGSMNPCCLVDVGRNRHRSGPGPEEVVGVPTYLRSNEATIKLTLEVQLVLDDGREKRAGGSCREAVCLLVAQNSTGGGCAAECKVRGSIQTSMLT